jgi:hypothetical protein
MPKSLNGSIYLVIGIDDATHTIFSEIFRSKDVIYKKIQAVISFISNSQDAYTVKTMHSDNGENFWILKFVSGSLREGLNTLSLLLIHLNITE